MESLEDAHCVQTGFSLCSLFATILKDSHPAQLRLLWDQCKGYICDDLEHYLCRDQIVVDPTQEQVEDYGLYLIDKILFHAGVFDGVKIYLNARTQL